MSSPRNGTDATAAAASGQQSKKKVSPELALAAARWLRDNRRGVETLDGVIMSRRVYYFRGGDAVDALMSGHFKHSELPSGSTRDDVIAVCQAILKAQHIHRAEPAPIPAGKKSRRKYDYDEPEPLVPSRSALFEDTDEALYAWLLSQSRTRLYIQSGFIVFFGFVACLIKVWPLWMKIAVWWLSTILLITMTSVLGSRLLLAGVFRLVGFKGLWPLPNLLDDEVEFWEAFSPLIGYGRHHKHGRAAAEQRAKERDEAREKERLAKRTQKRIGDEVKIEDTPAVAASSPKSKADKAATTTPAAAATSSTTTAATDDKKDDASKKSKEKVIAVSASSKFEWKFGLINLCVILIIGITICNQLGLFAGENIPDFLISQRDLYKFYPALAPPGYVAPEQPATPPTEPTTSTASSGADSVDEVDGDDATVGDDNAADVIDDDNDNDDVDEPWKKEWAKRA